MELWAINVRSIKVEPAAAVGAAAAAVLAASWGRDDHLGGVRLVVGPVQEKRHREVRRVDLELLVLEDLEKNREKGRHISDSLWRVAKTLLPKSRDRAS